MVVSTVRSVLSKISTVFRSNNGVHVGSNGSLAIPDRVSISKNGNGSYLNKFLDLQASSFPTLLSLALKTLFFPILMVEVTENLWLALTKSEDEVEGVILRRKIDRTVAAYMAEQGMDVISRDNGDLRAWKPWGFSGGREEKGAEVTIKVGYRTGTIVVMNGPSVIDFIQVRG